MRIEVDGHETFAYTGSRAPVAGQPSIVFVHGAGLDHTVWVMQARYFAHHGYNAFAVDLPGHGRSAGAPAQTIEAMADWVARFITATGAETASIAGHSMGSLICLACAARHPDLVAGAALVGTAVPMQVADVLQGAADANSPDAYDMITIWGHSLPAQVGGGPHTPGIWLTGSSVRLLERGGDGVLAGDLRACNAFVNGAACAAQVRCPTLLVLGQLDMMTPPRAARDLHAALSNASRVELDGAGHMLMAERPDAVLDALLDFTRARARTASAA